ncbi:MAG: GNAT family N-acetyltransferase [Parachlamydiaceae bacterium]
MLTLKKIEEGDCEKFIELLIEQLKKEGNTIKIKNQLRARILKCITSKESTILVAIEQDQVKGYLIIHWLHELREDAPEALISGFYVASHARNTGIGTALLETAVQWAKNHHCSRLWLENNRHNPIYSKQFYKKRGWNERLDLAIFEFPPSS